MKKKQKRWHRFNVGNIVCFDQRPLTRDLAAVRRKYERKGPFEIIKIEAARPLNIPHAQPEHPQLVTVKGKGGIEVVFSGSWFKLK